MKSFFARGVVGALFAVCATGAMAQQVSNNQVAVKEDWNVFMGENPTECWAVSIPKETVNTRDGREVNATRGEIQLMVFFRPSQNVRQQVAFTGGYPFRDGSTVTVDVGGSKFEMFVQGEWAWLSSQAEDDKLVGAMKRGANAVVTGISGRGTQTKDTFSLTGFTAAVDDAATRCKQ
ncbi:hypothetical protein HJ526_01835 [Donghicola sp. C2-DW-16]|uniref:Invasion associated locus B family protein n=1 Tax=Donghicola mangrovi TaxID=2729614 RepID=A0A850Q8G5_9RHOB|nr:invasion associated locus B family protein [Donghicola mangrovi]NVO22261.1 hypothetical protein [Donghicola mangrovi]NVO26148.1 hypothetical protein [Donghicola mangrovi]